MYFLTIIFGIVEWGGVTISVDADLDHYAEVLTLHLLI